MVESVTLDSHSVAFWRKASLWVFKVSLLDEKRHFGFSKYRYWTKSVTLDSHSVTFWREASLWVFKVSLFGGKRHFEFSKYHYWTKSVTLDFQSVAFWREASLWIFIVSLFSEICRFSSFFNHKKIASARYPHQHYFKLYYCSSNLNSLRDRLIEEVEHIFKEDVFDVTIRFFLRAA